MSESASADARARQWLESGITRRYGREADWDGNADCVASLADLLTEYAAERERRIQELTRALEHAKARLRTIIDGGIDEDSAFKVATQLHDEWHLISSALSADAGKESSEA